jgi:glycosyltransferase involved in cell wall biosynthesis
VADPADLLRACRGVVVSSISQRQGPESFGRTVIEAWAYRKPVVAFAAGGVNYLIENERDGLLVPEGDEEALAEALDRLWRDEALGRRLGEAGYAKVCRTYEAGRVASALLGALAGPATNPIV